MTVDAVRVVVADDQTLFRSGLARLLSDDPRIEVVGVAANGQEAVQLNEELHPDVILMDLKMPILDGLEATKQIVASGRGGKILVLTTFETDDHVVAALRAGASGYVLKDCQPEAIASSIIAVNLGDQVMASTVASRVIDLATGAPRTTEGGCDGLTPRELEILRLVAEGTANKQIAHRLQISDKTVRNHLSHMYGKLKIFDRSQAVLYAARKGLVQL